MRRECVDGIYRAYDRGTWLTVVNTVMNIQGRFWLAEELLASQEAHCSVGLLYLD